MSDGLTTAEVDLLALLALPKLQSDRKIRDVLGMSQHAVLFLAVSLRRKLGLADGASLREYARRHVTLTKD